MIRRTLLLTCSLCLFISFDFQPMFPALTVRSFLGLWFAEVAASPLTRSKTLVFSGHYRVKWTWMVNESALWHAAVRTRHA